MEYKKHKNLLVYLTLASILMLGFGLRIYNISEIYHVDEPNIVKRAVTIADGKWHISWYNWPAQSLMRVDALLFKTYGTVHNLKHGTETNIPEQFKANEKIFYTIARSVSIFLALISIFFIFLIGKTIHNANTGLLAALFLTVSCLHVLQSRYATPDVPMTAGFLILIYLSLLLFKLPLNNELRKNEFALYAIAGAVFGFLMATKYTSALGIVPIALIFIYRFCASRQWSIKIIAKEIYQIFCWPILFFIISCFLVHTIFNPYFFTDLNLVIKALLFEAKGDRITATWTNGQSIFWQNLYYYIRSQQPWNGMIISFVAGLGMLGTLISWPWKKNNQLLSLLIFLTVIVISLSSLPLHWSRWAVPIVPFISLFAAWSINSSYHLIIKKIKYKKIVLFIFIVITIIAIFPQLFLSWANGNAIDNPSTNEKMRIYIEENLESGSKIMADNYKFKLSKDYKITTQNLEIYNQTTDDLKANGFQYVIVKNSRLGAAKQRPKKFKNIIDFFNELNDNSELLVTYKAYDGVLNNKKDTKFYEWLWQNKISDIENITNGATISLYKIN
ncbi:MAG: glycosyltransferase family 39 protein [Patescibacteria group bacterium]